MVTYTSKIAKNSPLSHLAPSLGATPCQYGDEPYIPRNEIQWATFLSQTVSPSAGRGELRKLTEVTENCGKDTLHEFCSGVARGGTGGTDVPGRRA